MYPGGHLEKGGHIVEDAALGSGSSQEQAVGATALEGFVSPENTLEIGDFTPYAELGFTFADVGGNEKLLKRLSRLKYTFDDSAYAQNARKRWGDSSPAGILLFGLAGSGKTMIFTALAHSLGADLWKIMGNHIMDPARQGQSERNMARVFEIAGSITTNTVLFLTK